LAECSFDISLFSQGLGITHTHGSKMQFS